MERFEIDVTDPAAADAESADGDGRSGHTDSSMGRGQDAQSRAESSDADDAEAALIEAAEQGLMAAGRVDIRA